MKKTLYKFTKIAAVLLTIVLVFSCSSVRDPDNVFSDIDYTKEDARREESKRIFDLLEKNPIQALWRANFLKDEETTKACENAVLEEFNSAVEKSDWFNASRIAKSLQTISSPLLSSLSKNYSELDILSKKVPGLTKESRFRTEWAMQTALLAPAFLSRRTATS